MNSIRTTTGYEVVTAVGATVYTASDLDMAREWLAERKTSLAGAYVEEVVTTIVRRAVYRPRLRLVGAA